MESKTFPARFGRKLLPAKGSSAVVGPLYEATLIQFGEWARHAPLARVAQGERAQRFSTNQVIKSAHSDAAREATAMPSAGALPSAGAKLTDKIASRTPTPAGAANATKPPTVASAYKPEVDSATLALAPNARESKKPCAAQVPQYKACAKSSANGTKGPVPATFSARTTKLGKHARSTHVSTMTVTLKPSTVGIAHAPSSAVSPLYSGKKNKDANPTPPPTAVQDSISSPTEEPTASAETPRRAAPAMRTKGKPTMPGV